MNKNNYYNMKNLRVTKNAWSPSEIYATMGK